MTPDEVSKALTDVELVPCAEMALADARRLVDACLEADVPALVHREACAKPGCSPKFQVLVRPEDGTRVATLLQQRWMDSIQREGVLAEGAVPFALPASEDAEPPCPACGTVAALVEGACADCGLQLE